MGQSAHRANRSNKAKKDHSAKRAHRATWAHGLPHCPLQYHLGQIGILSGCCLGSVLTDTVRALLESDRSTLQAAPDWAIISKITSYATDLQTKSGSFGRDAPQASLDRLLLFLRVALWALKGAIWAMGRAEPTSCNKHGYLMDLTDAGITF